MRVMARITAPTSAAGSVGRAVAVTNSGNPVTRAEVPAEASIADPVLRQNRPRPTSRAEARAARVAGESATSSAHVRAPTTVARANPSPASPSHQATPATARRSAASTVSRTAYRPHFSVPDRAPAVAAWRLNPRMPNAMIATPAPENVGNPTGVQAGVLTTTSAARASPSTSPAGSRRTRGPSGGPGGVPDGPASTAPAGTAPADTAPGRRADRTARVVSCISPLATPPRAKNAPQ